MANPPFRSSDQPGLFLGFSLVDPPNIRHLKTCSLTLHKAVNECRQVGSVSQAPLAKVKGCHIYRRHSQWKVSLATTSLEDLSIFSEGISVVENFTVGNKNQDCNHIEDTGVESVKGMSKFDSLSDPEVQTLMALELMIGA